jgi:hypothetical protein
MPPPASHTLKAKGLWSLPRLAWRHGIRPNSVVQKTMVSSNSPRDSQVLDQRQMPVAGWWRIVRES